MLNQQIAKFNVLPTSLPLLFSLIPDSPAPGLHESKGRKTQFPSLISCARTGRASLGGPAPPSTSLVLIFNSHPCLGWQPQHSAHSIDYVATRCKSNRKHIMYARNHIIAARQTILVPGQRHMHLCKSACTYVCSSWLCGCMVLCTHPPLHSAGPFPCSFSMLCFVYM